MEREGCSRSNRGLTTDSGGSNPRICSGSNPGLTRSNQSVSVGLTERGGSPARLRRI